MVELNFAIEGILAAGMTLLSILAKREFGRIDDNFKTLFDKLDRKLEKADYDKQHGKLEADMEAKCKERRATCDPCRKTVGGLQDDMDKAINCINKHVDNCDI